MELLKLNIQMFADGKVVIDTDLNDNGFKNGLNKMQSIAKTGFKTIATSVGVASTAIAGLLGYGVKYNTEIEQLKTSFEVMTGSANKASEVIEKLKEVGAKTPYELKGLAQTTQTLMQYGLSADEAYEATLNFGDIAQGSAEKMQSIALAYGQMSSAGKVNMQDIRQMINAGFNPLQAIAEMTGETMQEVTARYEENAISVEEVTKAMKFASSEGGKFYQSMEKQSETLSGQISTLQDNFANLAGTLSTELSQSISGDVLPAINDMLTSLETAFNEGGIGELAESLGEGLANIIGALTQEIPKFIEVAMLIVQNFIMTFINMLPQILQTGITILIELIKGIAQSLPELIPTIVDAVMLIVETLIDNIDLIIDAGIELIIGLADGLIEALPILIDKVPIIIEKLINALVKNFPKIVKAGGELIGKLVMGITGAIWKLIEVAPLIIGNIVRGINNLRNQIADTGKYLVEGLYNGILSKANWLYNQVRSFAKNIISNIKSALGIHSPSTVMRDEVGKYLAQGLGVGFDKELDSVYNDMQRAIDLETGKMSANVQASGTYQMAMAGTPTFNLVDNASNTTQLIVNGKVLAEVVNTENRNREVATS